MQRSFIGWMNNTLNFNELSKYLNTNSDLALINELESIETDALNHKSLEKTLNSWITKKDDGEEEGDDTKSFRYFLLKSEGIENAVITICYHPELQDVMKHNNLLFKLFQTYLIGTPSLHSKIVNLILENEYSDKEDSVRCVKAIKKLVGILKIGFNEAELLKKRDNLASEIYNCILNNTLKIDNVEEFHKKLKSNFENVDKISQENFEIAISNFEHLEKTLTQLTEAAENSMKGLDAKKKALINYYNDKREEKEEEFKTYTDTLESLQNKLSEISTLKGELQNELNLLLVQVRKLEGKILEQNEIEAQMNRLIVETNESIESKKDSLRIMEEELAEELREEQSKYSINQFIKNISTQILLISEEGKKEIINRQESNEDEFSNNFSEAEKIICDLMQCKYDNQIDITRDKDKFKEELFDEIKNYKKYIKYLCNL